MSSQLYHVLLIMNLTGRGTYAFRYFATAIDTSRRANWNPQDVTIGTKPLFYANRDPRRLEIGEVWIDNTDTGDSITPELDQLFALQDETDAGTPPVLLVQWGDRQERVVLEEINVSETFFHSDGTPLRARLSLTFIEIQDERRAETSVNVIDDDPPIENRGTVTGRPTAGPQQ